MKATRAASDAQHPCQESPKHAHHLLCLQPLVAFDKHVVGVAAHRANVLEFSALSLGVFAKILQ
jgi:hypothetical protein